MASSLKIERNVEDDIITRLTASGATAYRYGILRPVPAYPAVAVRAMASPDPRLRLNANTPPSYYRVDLLLDVQAYLPDDTDRDSLRAHTKLVRESLEIDGILSVLNAASSYVYYYAILPSIATPEVEGNILHLPIYYTLYITPQQSTTTTTTTTSN